ncbi:hypothetical protein M0R04_10220 [Candidatus Dojkabacteria bacterium]|jgi:5-methylcytosine-specific restriction endonuclease McrA|nr:hypothetical protein [Candidatus Dojkabacteria bacterium]
MEIFTKLCIACGKELGREQNKFCSRKCNLDINGTEYRFKKGNIPWHIGKIGLLHSNSGSFKKGSIPWNIGKHIMINDALIKWKKNNPSPFKGWKHSEETKQLIRLKRANQKNPSGEKHWNWKGGTSPLRKSIQNTRKYRNWRTEVFKRDNYICQFCKKRGNQINADHIKPFYKIIEEYKIDTVEKAKRCEELWNISNGRTLCVPCHKQTPSYLVNQHTK